MAAQIALDGLPAAGRSPTALAWLGDTLLVANRITTNLSVIQNGHVKQVVPLDTSPKALAADEQQGRAFLLHEDDPAVRIAAAPAGGGSLTVTEGWPLPTPGDSVALIGDALWVGLAEGGRIVVLSTKDGALQGEVAGLGASPVFHLAASPDGTTAYAATYDTLFTIDARGRTVVAQAPLEGGYRPLCLSPDGARLYLTDYDVEAGQSYILAHQVTPAAPSMLPELWRAPVPADVSDIVVTGDGSRLLVLSSFTNELTILSTADGRTVGRTVTGLRPQAAALSADGTQLYVANAGSHNVSVVDIDADPPGVVSTIPLAPELNDLDVDPFTGKLYIADGARDAVLVSDGAAVIEAIPAGRYPRAVLAVPGRSLLAVLTRADQQLLLIDAQGQVVHRQATMRDPQGLTYDERSGVLYAADLALDLNTVNTSSAGAAVRSLSLTTELFAEVAPVQVTLDTRRGIPYAVVFNGIPGSNGGYVVRPLEDTEQRGASGIGRLSVIDLLYDEEFDRFYTTNSRMGSYGLQVNDAATGRETHALRLPRYPQDAALNPATRHLWVALSEPSSYYGAGAALTAPATTLLRAYDTATMQQVVELAIGGEVRALAVDPRSNRVYVADVTHGIIHVVQDVLMEPPTPAATPTLAPPSPTPLPPPRVAATSAPSVKASATRAPATTAPTPRPTCSLAVADEVEPLRHELGLVDGPPCPLGEIEEGQWATQPFEDGRMLWRGATGTLFALYDDGSYVTGQDAWTEGMPNESCEADPPADREQPIRGFGLFWCREPGVRARLGWAMAGEAPLVAQYQRFDQGALFVPEVGQALWLDRSGAWRTVVE